MKKILIGLIGLALIGGGCATNKEGSVIEEVEKNSPITYTNKKYGYTFVRPAAFGILDGNNDTQPASPDENANNVEVIRAEEGMGPNDRVIFLVEKTTVYPESKLMQLRERYLRASGNITEKKITLGGKSGWELTNNNINAGSTQAARLLFFPYGENDFIIIQEPNEPEHVQIVNSLQFTK